MKTFFKTITIVFLIMGASFTAESRIAPGSGGFNPGPVDGLKTHIGYYLEEYTYLDAGDAPHIAYRVKQVVRYNYFSCVSALMYQVNIPGNSLISNCNI